MFTCTRIYKGENVMCKESEQFSACYKCGKKFTIGDTIFENDPVFGNNKEMTYSGPIDDCCCGPIVYYCNECQHGFDKDDQKKEKKIVNLIEENCDSVRCSICNKHFMAGDNGFISIMVHEQNYPQTREEPGEIGDARFYCIDCFDEHRDEIIE